MAVKPVQQKRADTVAPCAERDVAALVPAPRPPLPEPRRRGTETHADALTPCAAPRPPISPRQVMEHSRARACWDTAVSSSGFVERMVAVEDFNAKNRCGCSTGAGPLLGRGTEPRGPRVPATAPERAASGVLNEFGWRLGRWGREGAVKVRYEADRQPRLGPPYKPVALSWFRAGLRAQPRTPSPRPPPQLAQAGPGRDAHQVRHQLHDKVPQPGKARGLRAA
jgi:hypothetical protein